MNRRKKSKSKIRLEEIEYSEIPKYEKIRKGQEKIKGFKTGLKRFGKRTGESIRRSREGLSKMGVKISEAREKSKPFFKNLGENVKKGIEFEKKAFGYGAKAISKGWEYGFEKPFEMREESQREMEKQRKELGF